MRSTLSWRPGIAPARFPRNLSTAGTVGRSLQAYLQVTLPPHGGVEEGGQEQAGWQTCPLTGNTDRPSSLPSKKGYIFPLC